MKFVEAQSKRTSAHISRPHRTARRNVRTSTYPSLAVEDQAIAPIIRRAKASAFSNLLLENSATDIFCYALDVALDILFTAMKRVPQFSRWRTPLLFNCKKNAKARSGGQGGDRGTDFAGRRRDGTALGAFILSIDCLFIFTIFWRDRSRRKL